MGPTGVSRGLSSSLNVIESQNYGVVWLGRDFQNDLVLVPALEGPLTILASGTICETPSQAVLGNIEAQQCSPFQEQEGEVGAAVGGFVHRVTSGVPAPSPCTPNPAKGGAEGSWAVGAQSVLSGRTLQYN